MQTIAELLAALKRSREVQRKEHKDCRLRLQDRKAAYQRFIQIEIAITEIEALI